MSFPQRHHRKRLQPQYPQCLYKEIPPLHRLHTPHLPHLPALPAHIFTLHRHLPQRKFSRHRHIYLAQPVRLLHHFRHLQIRRHLRRKPESVSLQRQPIHAHVRRRFSHKSARNNVRAIRCAGHADDFRVVQLAPVISAHDAAVAGHGAVCE